MQLPFCRGHAVADTDSDGHSGQRLQQLKLNKDGVIDVEGVILFHHSKSQTTYRVCHCIVQMMQRQHPLGSINSLWTVHGEVDANTALSSRQSCTETCMTASAVTHMTQVMLLAIPQFVHSKQTKVHLCLPIMLSLCGPSYRNTVVK